MRPLALLLAAFTAQPAHAYIFVGNPAVLQIEHATESIDSAVAYIEGVRTQDCSGATMWQPVQAWVDLTDGWELPPAIGEICTVSIDWGADVTVSSATWTLLHHRERTHLSVGADGTAVTHLDPYLVTDGAVSGPPVRLTLTPNP